MHRLQFSSRMLLFLTTFTSILVAALTGVFGERIQEAVSNFTIFFTFALIWIVLQIVTYALVATPVVLLLLLFHRVASSLR